MSDLVDVAETAVKAALAAGADHAEAYAMRSLTVRVAAAGRYAEPTVKAKDGIGMRVSLGGRLGIAGVESLQGMDGAVAAAMDAAKRSEAPADFPFAAPRKPLHDARFVPDVDDATGAHALGTVEAFIEDALSRSIVTYAQATVVRHTLQVAIANSLGTAVTDRTGGANLDVEVRVSRGTAHLTSREAYAADIPRLDPTVALDELVSRAERALTNEPLSGPAVDHVILAPTPASQILSLAGGALSGAAIEAGRSPFPKEPGRAAYADVVDILDDPRGRRVFDDEGTPTRARPIVSRGRIAGHLHDLRTADALGVEPTGNAHRSGVLGGVTPKPRRLVMAGGEATMDDLVAAAERAVLVPDPLLGFFVSDKVTGDFSVVAPIAFYVEGGRVRHALPATTIGGNVHDVLRRVKLLGRDVRPCPGASVPALLAGGVTCAA